MALSMRCRTTQAGTHADGDIVELLRLASSFARQLHDSLQVALFYVISCLHETGEQGDLGFLRQLQSHLNETSLCMNTLWNSSSSLKAPYGTPTNLLLIQNAKESDHEKL